jgi:hypothetical protein
VRKVLELFATILEDHVNDRFRQSPNENIRYSMETTEEREVRYKRAAEEREARRRQKHAEREARLAAQSAQEVGSYFVGEDDEDE